MAATSRLGRIAPGAASRPISVSSKASPSIIGTGPTKIAGTRRAGKSSRRTITTLMSTSSKTRRASSTSPAISRSYATNCGPISPRATKTPSSFEFGKTCRNYAKPIQGIAVTDIVVVNRSTVLTDAAIAAVVPAAQAQVTEDWLPHWPGRGATLHFAGLGAPVPTGMWPLNVLDTTDVPGAGGYHDDDTGLPEGKVFAGDAMKYGEAWTVDL